ncbi:MAG: Beta-propeller repeat protein [Syntrophorhabdaceae bacterium PtaU1.Bin034]|nr:MAG: Beta-propeller repeat protein [Syntrophorhabdaceae bacterium PtaU1.Bin034]
MYSTYLGGSANDYAQGIAVDSSGNAHVAGTTGSSNFPTVNAYQASSAGNFDAFVSKFNASGTLLMYSTYLGGWQTDSASSIAVDDSGNAYVAGHTFSNDFPTLNAYQTSCSDSDAFVAKLDASGNALYSTYLGGTYGDYGTGIAVDTAGNAYVTGYTKSPNFPTLNAYQSSFKGYYDTFITKLAPTGSALVYSTFLGGVGDDWSQGIAVDSFGNAYVVGYTSSTNFPTKDAYQAMNRTNTDSFVTKLDASGSSLCYSTYLGGTGYDFGHAIAIDSSGNAYVTGETASTNFPMKHPYQGSLAGGTYDVFITKLDPTSPYVDLNLKSISNPPSIISTEENFSVTVAVQNRSNVPLGGFVTKYYLSNTPKMMKAKLLTGTLVFPFIEAETTSVRTMNVSVPTGTPAGVYYLFACVDDQKAVAESDEKNNCKVASRTVSLRAVPRFSAPPSPKPPLKN